MAKNKSKNQIIIPSNIFPKPTVEEMWVAWILLDFFKRDIIFVERNNIKTPDFCIDGIFWELKSPVGNGNKTIENLLRSASKQSKNIILSLKRTKIRQNRAVSDVCKFLSYDHYGINRVLIIAKNKNIIDLRKKR